MLGFPQPKTNYTATADPTVNDDVSLHYEVGSRWINTTTGVEYVCVDNTNGAAVWNSATASAFPAAPCDWCFPTYDGSAWVNAKLVFDAAGDLLSDASGDPVLAPC